MNKTIFLLAGMVVIGYSCQYVNGPHIEGNGRMGAEERTVTGFSGVETHGAIDIIASQGDYHIKVEADENLLQYIETRVENGRLVARFREGMAITDFNSAKVYVSAPVLNAFETHGSGNISGQGKIADKDKMGIAIDGSGDIELNLDCPVIKLRTTGSGNITLSGETQQLSCEITGSGDIKARGCNAATAKVLIHGSGDAEISAADSLDVEISGSGDVHYKGQPKINSSIHGSGELSKMD